MIDRQALQEEALQHIDDAFGEAIRFAPYSGNTLDRTREMWTGRGVLRVGGGTGRLDTVNLGGSFRTQIESSKAELYIARSALRGIVVRAGDRIRADDRAGQPWWRIALVEDRHDSRLVCTLAAL